MAVISKTKIANLALSHIRAKSNIQNVDTEQSVEAKKAKLWYDVARQEVLADSDWGFARKRVSLATHSVDPPDEWSYRYQYPADCVKPRRIVNPVGADSDVPPHTIENAGDGTRSIISDTDDAELVYTRDEETTDLFTPSFTIALSYKLAFYLVGSLTGKGSLETKMAAAYSAALNHGEAVDAGAEKGRAPRQAGWIEGR